MLPAITMKRTGGCGHTGLNCVCSLWRCALGVLVITVGAQGDHKSNRNEAPEPTGLVAVTGRFAQTIRLLAAASGFAQAIRLLGRSCGTQDVPGLLLSVFARSGLEGETFTESGPLTIPGKGRDVGKYFCTTLSRRDESKAAIIVPFCKRAFYAHKYSSLAPLTLILGNSKLTPLVGLRGRTAKNVVCPLLFSTIS
jgi:hypothetical protein